MRPVVSLRSGIRKKVSLLATETNHSCDYCRWVAGLDRPVGGILLETSDWVVIHHQKIPCPIPGWIHVVSRHHTPVFGQLSETSRSGLFRLLESLTQTLTQLTRADAVDWVMFPSAGGHWNAQLIPVNRSVPPDFRGPALFSWQPDMPSGILGVEGFCDHFRSFQAESLSRI